MMNFPIISTEASAEIARLTTKNDELDSKIEVGQQQSLELTYQMISKIGAVNNQLEMLVSQLISSNETLENQIIELKDQHEKEINNLFAPVNSEIKLIALKVRLLVEKLELYQIGDFAKANTISEPAVELLKTLIADIVKYQDMAITYPKYDDLKNDLKEKPLAGHQKQIVSFPITAEITFAKNDSILKAFIEEAELTYEALKLDLEPLESTCQSLISEKEMMVDFHKKFMEKFKKEELHLPLKEVYDLISSTFKQIEWNKLFILKSSVYLTSNYKPHIRGLRMQMHQEKLDIKANKLKEKMGLIVTNLGSIVNQEISKEGTKS